MKWEHKLAGFEFADAEDFNRQVEKWGEAGWEAVNLHFEYEDNLLAAIVLFKKMKPMELTGDID